MERETVIALLQLVGRMCHDLDDVRRIIDAEALQVGDRNMIDHALTTITGEVEVLSRTLSDMLTDPSKMG